MSYQRLGRYATLMWIATICTTGCLILASCTTVPAQPPSSVTVMAAASLTEAMTEIGQAFTAAHPGVDLQFNFAGSQQLAFHLAQGAPADVFASADAVQMTAAIEAGRVVTGTPQLLTTNRLVVIYPAANPANLRDLGDLARPGIKLLVADPNAPVGRYSQVFIDQASQAAEYGDAFGRQVRANIVSYEENVRAVLSKVVLGEADAGIVYTSDAATENVGTIEIPDELNVVAQYYIAPVGNSSQPALAQAFVDLATSPDGQAILAAHGFGSSMAAGATPP